MPESSHKKGEEYQRNVRHLLTKTRLLGLESELFGDAYDVTRKACTVGGVAFDFSLRLGQGEVARHVVYVECKFRQEKTANLNGEFRNFLKRSYDALLAAEEDEGRTAVFLFASNIPPDDWRRFVRGKVAYCRENVDFGDAPRDDHLATLVGATHLLALGDLIISRD